MTGLAAKASARRAAAMTSALAPAAASCWASAAGKPACSHWLAGACRIARAGVGAGEEALAGVWAGGAVSLTGTGLPAPCWANLPALLDQKLPGPNWRCEPLLASVSVPPSTEPEPPAVLAARLADPRGLIAPVTPPGRLSCTGLVPSLTTVAEPLRISSAPPALTVKSAAPTSETMAPPGRRNCRVPPVVLTGRPGMIAVTGLTLENTTTGPVCGAAGAASAGVPRTVPSTVPSIRAVRRGRSEAGRLWIMADSIRIRRAGPRRRSSVRSRKAGCCCCCGCRSGAGAARAWGSAAP